MTNGIKITQDFINLIQRLTYDQLINLANFMNNHETEPDPVDELRHKENLEDVCNEIQRRDSTEWPYKPGWEYDPFENHCLYSKHGTHAAIHGVEYTGSLNQVKRRFVGWNPIISNYQRFDKFEDAERFALGTPLPPDNPNQ